MKYEELVNRYFDIRSISGSEAMCICVFHDDSNASLQVNLDSGLFLCFSCDAKGGPVTLFQEVGVDIRNNAEENLDIREVITKINKLRRPERPKVERIYTEDYLMQFDMPTDYWGTRDLSDAIVRDFQLGYDAMSNAVTIPLRNVDGELLGVIRRSLDKNPEVRYRYPTSFKRSHHLFGDWLVNNDKSATRVVLTEGSLDAIRVTEAGYNGMAVYGSSISETQVRLLRQLGVLKVTLFFDDDNAGRKARDRCLGITYNRRKGQVIKNYDAGLDLRKFFVVDYVKYPKTALPSFREDEEAFDPGDMRLEDIDRLLHKTIATI